MPTFTFSPRSDACVGTADRAIPPLARLTTVSAPVATTSPGIRFIDGLPMNCATNSFSGRSYSSSGVPTWLIPPPASTTMRDASVIAST